MDPVALLADEAFARRIALGLLRDRDAADDLVQEVWLEVLKRPPRHGASPRGYLATLLRRLWLRNRRTGERRAAREQAHVADAADHGAPELVARAEIHQRTVAETLALDEPYRSTVLRRYFEDLTPEEIAARERISVETVRTRLKRALAMLRARLEREGRDWREEWVVVLGLDRAEAPRPGALERTSLARWGSVVVVTAATLGIVWLARGEPRTEPRASPPAVDVAAHPPVPADAAALVSAAGNEESRFAAEVTRAPAPAVPMLLGRVVDEAGNPLQGARVDLAIESFQRIPGLDCTFSDAEGAFALSLERWAALPEASRAHFRLVLNSWSRGRGRQERFVDLGPDGMPLAVEVVLDPGRVAFARVVDGAGAPSADVRVTYTVRRDDPSQPPHGGGVITDRDGLVAFGLAPGERVTDLVIWHEGRGFAYRGEHELPGSTGGDVDLGTIPLEPGLPLSGRCVYSDGQPARSLSLTSVLVEPAPDGGFQRAADGPRSDFAGGVTKLNVMTDELGRFAFHGLRDGLYQLHSPASVPFADGAAWRAGGPEIEVVLTIRRLIVEVFGPEDELLIETPIALTHLTAARSPTGESFRMMAGHAGNPRAILVEAGETVAVLALAPGCGSVEQLVPIPALPHETSLRLYLAREERSAVLALRPSRPDDGWRVDLCAPFSGAPLPGLQDLVPDAEGRIHGVPVGSYRMRIEALPSDGGAVARDFAVPTAAPLALAAGETVLDFEVVPAARLRVAFGPRAAADQRAPIDLEHLEGTATDRWSWLASSMRTSRSSFELWMIAPDGERPLRRVFGLKPRAGDRIELSVPAGALRLRVALDGRDPIEHELSPATGETLEIPVPLDESAPAR